MDGTRLYGDAKAPLPVNGLAGATYFASSVHDEPHVFQDATGHVGLRPPDWTIGDACSPRQPDCKEDGPAGATPGPLGVRGQDRGGDP